MRDLPSSGRARWADVAKGACIVLVVLWHVTRKDYLQLPWEVDLPVAGAWGSVSELLLPVRMPLFFLISGRFAAQQLERPWSAVCRTRIAPLVYLFVLWTVLHTVVLQATPGFDTAVADGPGELLVQLTVTPGNLWYLLALATYVAVARATRSAPHWALAGALALSTVASAGLVPTPGNRAGLLVNLVWFLLGTRLSALTALAGRWARPGPVARIALVAAFVAGAGAWQALDADAWPGVRPALGALGIAVGLVAASALDTVPRLATPLAALGRQTLPIYVIHLPLVALAHVASVRIVTDGSTVATSTAFVLAYPVVVTALVVVTSLLLHRLLVAVGATWLFEAPWRDRRRKGVADALSR